MKYTEASAQVVTLDNMDVACSLISGDNTSAAINAFLDEYGHNLPSSQRQDMIKLFATGENGFAKMVNEYANGLSENELEQIFKNKNTFSEWVNNTCGSQARSYSTDTEEDFFDNEVSDNETDW